MAVGQNAQMSFPSYIGFARESTYGTYVTGTAGIDFMSCSLKTVKENKVIEEISNYRMFADSIGIGKKVEGELEIAFDPKSTAACYLLQNALGGAAVTSATATGETAGGLAFTHTMVLGDFTSSVASLSANLRKGDSAGKVFEFSGLRINECSIVAEQDEPIKMSFGLIGKDSTITSNDISSTIGVLNTVPLSFANGRLSIESALASLTTTSFWHVTNIEMTIKNNLKADADSRRIGSDVLQVLPPGICEVEVNFGVRFDTTTAYAAMLAGTNFALEVEFLGDTLTTSIIRQGLKIQFPKIVLAEAADPEIGGPDEILKTEVRAIALRDTSSATGYAFKAYVTNAASSI
jgi:hypothetical protein